MVITWILYKLVRFNTSTITCHGKRIRVYIADNFAGQALGLMYRRGLERGEGMLLAFGRERRWGIWMANMRFGIDIIWLDGKGKVVDIKRNARPCTSLFNCKTHAPARDSKYVLELASGTASRYRIKAGDTIGIGSF